MIDQCRPLRVPEDFGVAHQLTTLQLLSSVQQAIVAAYLGHALPAGDHRGRDLPVVEFQIAPGRGVHDLHDGRNPFQLVFRDAGEAVQGVGVALWPLDPVL